jgi:hypothetical protein
MAVRPNCARVRALLSLRSLAGHRNLVLQLPRACSTLKCCDNCFVDKMQLSGRTICLRAGRCSWWVVGRETEAGLRVRFDDDLQRAKRESCAMVICPPSMRACQCRGRLPKSAKHKRKKLMQKLVTWGADIRGKRKCKGLMVPVVGFLLRGSHAGPKIEPHYAR